MRKRRVALAVAALAVACLLPPASAHALKKGFLGPAQVNGESAFPIYRDLGVDVFQQIVYWHDVAPNRPANPTNPGDPAYVWPAEVDSAIAEAQRNGMRVALIVLGAPKWANGGREWQWPPNEPQRFADFLEAAARRYPAVNQWLVWGEPTRRQNFQPLSQLPLFANKRRREAAGRGPAPRRYAALLDAAYARLKSVRRSNVVIGGNSFTGGDVRPYEWIRNLRLRGGRPPRMDLYGHNPFSGRQPDLRNRPLPGGSVDFSNLDMLQDAVNRYLARPRGKRRIRLFLSEWTLPTGRDREFGFHVEPDVQATWIRSGFKIARRLRVDTLGWVHLQDEPASEGQEVIRGGLIFANGERKPGYDAFKGG